jgi:alpha-tubulin suppressor-like RCC1 family protein
VGTNKTWVTVVPGYWHTCATRRNGSGWCWGANSFGQIGDGTTTQRNQPVNIPAG